MENQDSLNKQYENAKKRNFKGSFKDFCDTMNRFKTEMLTKKQTFLNDSGANQNATNDNLQQNEPAQKPAEVMNASVLNENEQNMQSQRPVAGVGGTAASHQGQFIPGPAALAEDDKIMGMSKGMFYTMLAFVILLLGSGIFLIWSNSSKEMNLMPARRNGEDNASKEV